MKMKFFVNNIPSTFRVWTRHVQQTACLDWPCPAILGMPIWKKLGETGGYCNGDIRGQQEKIRGLVKGG